MEAVPTSWPGGWRIRGAGRLSAPQRRGALFLLLLLLTACGAEGPTGPDPLGLELIMVRGDGQAAEPGAALPIPLTVRAQSLANGEPEADVRVRWSLLEGKGAQLAPSSSRTDSAGTVFAHLTLGSEVGSYRVQAWVRGMSAPPVEFRAQAILVPELDSIQPGAAARPGDTLRLHGRNFAPDPGMNVVSFSGIRGQVVAAEATTLRVRVPDCLPPREVTVRVRVGTVLTEGVPLELVGEPASLQLAPGEDRALDVSDGLRCVHLPSSPGGEYLVVPVSTGTVGGAQYPYEMIGLARDGALAVPNAGPERAEWPSAPRMETRPSFLPPPLALQCPEAFAERLYEATERALAAMHSRSSEPGSAFPAPTREGRVGGREARLPTASRRAPDANRVPTVGDRREFKVLNDKGGFDRVSAELRLITENTLVYVDEKAPAGGLTDPDLEGLAHEFDDPVHGALTETFGTESDLDGNGRIIILFTPAVNRLSEEEGEGFVGGFFFGVDLLPGSNGSNGGEIFYAVVPDPLGKEGPPLSRSTVLQALPAVLAHEFEHMIHFNQRILSGGAEHQDALWLSEALAQMAEDVAGGAFHGAQAAQKAYSYRVGNWIRARLFLQAPHGVSVLASLPPGTLAERGAGWLLLKQVSGQAGQEGLLHALARSTRTGVANLTFAAGLDWPTLVENWAGSLFFDGTNVPVRPELHVPGVDLRQVLSQFDGTFPLVPKAYGQTSFAHQELLSSSAPDYYRIHPPSSGGLALGIGGGQGAAPDPALELRLLIVRIQ